MDEVTIKKNNDGLTVYLSGRVDAGNASLVQAEIDKEREKSPEGTMLIDAENLEYISSAGLRIILKLIKREPGLKIINANSEVYDIFEMTGFAELVTVEKAYRKLNVDGCDVIGRGAKGTVYRYDPETIIKVYKNKDSLPEIIRERELARRAFVLGIPTAISYDVCRVGDSFGSVFELLNAKSFSALIKENPEHIGDYAKQSANLLKQIHETAVKSSEMPDVRKLFFKWLNTDKVCLAPETAEKLQKLVEELPETHTMIHGDFHTNNIMQQGDEIVLIDMDTLSYGHPVLELGNVYICYVGFGEIVPKIVEDFLGISYAQSVEFWNIFLRAYLGTEDENEIQAATEKIRVISDVRLMNHYIRRNLDKTEEGKKTLELAVARIQSFLAKGESLEI